MRLLPFIAMWLVACGRSGFDDLRSGDGGDPTGDGGGSTGDGGGGDAMADGASLNPMVAFQAFTGTSQPVGRRSSGAALEPGTERLWMYGGYNGAYLADLNAYSVATNTWQKPTVTATVPTERERHSLAWEPTNNVLVLFGGQNRPFITFVHFDELWVYSPAAGAWTQIPKAGTWPAARKDAGLVWVPHLGKFLLYGGNDGANANNRMNDLYLLTLDVGTTTATWQLLASGGATAPKQSAGCVAYDPAGHRLILYGGETADGVDNNSTYQYLLDTNVWQLDTVTGTPPAPQSFQQCVWDPSIGRLVLYGGQANGGNPIGGYGIYDPATTTWSVPPATTTQPGARSDGAAVYSPNLGAMLWYGGRTGVTTYTSELILMDVN